MLLTRTGSCPKAAVPEHSLWPILSVDFNAVNLWNRVDVEMSLLNYILKRVNLPNYWSHAKFFQFGASKLKLTFLHLEAEVVLVCFLHLFFIFFSSPLLSQLSRKSRILAEIEWIGFFSSFWRYWACWEVSFEKLQGQMKEMTESQNVAFVSI